MPRIIDLSNLSPTQGFIIQGDAAGDLAGSSVSSAGDVNGDGFDDVIVGAPFGDEAYVLFGGAGGFGEVAGGRQVVDLATLSAPQGFVIQGAAGDIGAAGDFAGWSISAAGDVNGDGFADVIVGAPNNSEGGFRSGAAYVLFGGAGGFGEAVGGRQVIDLATLSGPQGFVIQGDAARDYAGWSVSEAGDVDGDGFADVIVGAVYNDRGGDQAGAAYVVFGGADGFGTTIGDRQVVDLTTLTPAQGFMIQGDAGDGAGASVSAAGDVNGDGFFDIIVSAFSQAYVVFGGAAGFGTPIDGRQVVDLTTLSAARGFVINAGASVSAAGDVNGDGFADVIVGSYVAFGGAAGFGTPIDGRQVVDLTRLSAAQGFVIQGTGGAGFSVSEAGDVDGDGFVDVIVGAPFNSNGGPNAGEAYVVFGGADGFGTTIGDRQVVDLTTLTAAEGFIIRGDAANGHTGGASRRRGTSTATASVM